MSQCEGVRRNRGGRELALGSCPQVCCATLALYLQVHCPCRGRPSHLSPIHVLLSLRRYIVRVVGMGAAELASHLSPIHVLLSPRRYIVRVVGMGAAELSSLETVRRSMYLVMEAMEGGTLKDAVVKQMTSKWVQGGAGGGRWGQMGAGGGR